MDEQNKLIYKLLSPDKCDERHLNRFYDMVVEGGQVIINGLEDRIKSADKLAFSESEGEIVGVASLKNPDLGYKKNIFKKANVEEVASNYKYEIGYAFTDKAYRRKGINRELIKLLMDKSDIKSFFATTKNDGMRKLLKEIGFKKLGYEYKNDRNEILTLYEYNGQK